MKQRKRVGILISGQGSNMQALIQAARNPVYPAEIACVVSNNPDALGLAFAHDSDIATKIINHRDFVTREAFDTALAGYLQTQNLDLICCAGFMRVMTPIMITPWAGRMLNIHPSLLPAYKGLHTHDRALADGAKIHGCTVHIVTEELDDGPIVAQAKVLVHPGDTPESLATRVRGKEHQLYIEALAKIAASF